MFAALGLFFSGYNNFVVGLALIGVRPALHPTPLATALVAAGTLAGMLAGALGLGRLADIAGRRLALILDLVLIVAFALASAIATSATELVVFRFLLGLGIGAGYPIGSSYVADVSPPQRRGLLMTVAFSGWGFGALAAGLVGWWLIIALPEPTAWRPMLASGALPAVATMVLLLTLGLPESDRWESSRANLVRLPFSALVSRRFIVRTVAACVPWWFMDVSVYGMALFTPTLLDEMGLTDPARIAAGTALLTVFTLAGFGVAALLIDRVGRRPLQLAGFVGMALALGALAMTGKHLPALWLLGLFAGFQLASNAGPNTTTWIVPAELFPTRIRASGQGLATAFSRTGAILGALALPLLSTTLGLRVSLILVAVTALLGGILTLAVLPETARIHLSD